MKIIVELTGTSPLLMHNPRMVDPAFDVVRLIAEITAKQSKTDEDNSQIQKLEWHGGLYEENGILVQPTSKPRKCIIDTGKITKKGTTINRALLFNSVTTPLIYDGPKDLDELYADSRYRSLLSVRIGKGRVMRMRPKFFPWALKVEGTFIEDAGINFDAFKKIVELAGVVTGMGDNRVNGYGRFVGKVVKA